MGHLSLLFGGTTWAEQLGRGVIGDIEMVHLFSQQGGGLHTLEFNLALPDDFYDPVLAEGSSCEVFCGGLRLGGARIATWDRVTGRIVADGLYRRAEKVRAEGPTGEATTNLQAAITRGNLVHDLGWNGNGNVTQVLESLSETLEATDGNATLAQVMTSYCTLTGKFWGLDANDVPYIKVDPQTPITEPQHDPEWALMPGVPLPPTDDASGVSQVTVRYLTGGTTQDPTSWGTQTATSTDPDLGGAGGGIQINISDLGLVITGPVAFALAENFLAVNNARSTYTEAIEVIPGQLTNTGSVPISGWAACLEVLGKRGLHHGALNKKLGTDGRTIAWVCGSTVFRDGPGGGQLTIGAVDLPPRTLSTWAAMLNQFHEHDPKWTAIPAGLPYPSQSVN